MQHQQVAGCRDSGGVHGHAVREPCSFFVVDAARVCALCSVVDNLGPRAELEAERRAASRRVREAERATDRASTTPERENTERSEFTITTVRRVHRHHGAQHHAMHIYSICIAATTIARAHHTHISIPSAGVPNLVCMHA